MELGITEKRVAHRIGADQFTVIDWEKGRTQIAVTFVRVRFLGYDFRRSQILGDRLRAARRARGLSHRALAQELRVDPSTILDWEHGRHTPIGQALIVWPETPLEVFLDVPNPGAASLAPQRYRC